MVGQPLQRKFRYGFEYSDCWVDDSRLVMLTARDAADRGAVIRTRTKLTRAERGDMWELVLNSRGRRDTARARVLVNAAGPWIGEVAENIIRMPLKKSVRLIKGSHIVVRRRFEHDTGYILQAPDGRVVVNPTGNSGLGKAGNGDTLTGILIGFVAQAVQMKIDIFETVVAAVRLRSENTDQTLASIGAEFSISASSCHRRWSFWNPPRAAGCSSVRQLAEEQEIALCVIEAITQGRRSCRVATVAGRH